MNITILLKLICNDTKVKIHSGDNSDKIFNIENEEFIIAQKFLRMIMKNESVVTTLTNMIMMINYMASFEKEKYRKLHSKVGIRN